MTSFDLQPTPAAWPRSSYSSAMARTSDFLDDAVNLPPRETSWRGWKPCHSVVYFVNGKRGQRGQKEEKLHSLKRDEDTDTKAKELPKTSSLKKKKKETLSWTALHTTETYGKIVCMFFFFLLHNEGIVQGIALTFTFAPSFFPKHDKHMKEPSKGRCRLCSPLSFYLPSPHASSLLLRSTPTTWLKSAPPEPSLLRTEPRSGARSVGSNLLVDIVPLFFVCFFR